MTRRHQRVDTGGRHQAAATQSKLASMLVDARVRALEQVRGQDPQRLAELHAIGTQKPVLEDRDEVVLRLLLGRG